VLEVVVCVNRPSASVKLEHQFSFIEATDSMHLQQSAKWAQSRTRSHLNQLIPFCDTHFLRRSSVPEDADFRILSEHKPGSARRQVNHRDGTQIPAESVLSLWRRCA
jgi:hypothetical protein